MAGLSSPESDALRSSPPSLAERRTNRPLPLRTSSDREPDHDHDHEEEQSVAQPVRALVRRRTELPSPSKRESATSPRYSARRSSRPSYTETDFVASRAIVEAFDTAQGLGTECLNLPTSISTLTPPVTPMFAQIRSHSDAPNHSRGDVPDVLKYDFSRLDYELSRATILGQGLWSTVHLASAEIRHTNSAESTQLTPPASPPKKTTILPPSILAVKIASRRDAQVVFKQEAAILTHLIRYRSSPSYIVPFFGLDERNNALVFEAVIGGSLENLNSRLKQMTEVARHLELRNLFPSIAADLVSGLEFIHTAGVVHADLKPANVLLDIDDRSDTAPPTIRARYIDFSASFRPDQASDSRKNAGGTWDYMAPEQMRLQPEWNTPTMASDVWSLGITLLSLIVGDSPYVATCGINRFMLREAIKSADPVGFARHDAKVAKRLAACQDFVDCCRLALQKDRDRRTTASAWRDWVFDRES